MTNEEALALIKKNPLSFGCLVVSFALAIGIYLRSETIPEVEAQLTQKSAEAERVAVNIQYSAQLKEHVESMTGAVKKIDERMVRWSDVGNNTQYFYTLESDTGAKVVSFQQTTSSAPKKPAKGSYVPIGFSVTAQGNLKQLLDFVRQLENGAHYSRVLSATFSANASERSSPLSLALNLELLGLP